MGAWETGDTDLQGPLLHQPARPAPLIPVSPPEECSGAEEVFHAGIRGLRFSQDTLVMQRDGLSLGHRVGGSRQWLQSLKAFLLGQEGLV